MSWRAVDASYDLAMKALAFSGYVVDIGQLSATAKRRLNSDRSLERFDYYGFPIPKRGWRVSRSYVIGLDVRS